MTLLPSPWNYTALSFWYFHHPTLPIQPKKFIQVNGWINPVDIVDLVTLSADHSIDELGSMMRTDEQHLWNRRRFTFLCSDGIERRTRLEWPEHFPIAYKLWRGWGAFMTEWEYNGYGHHATNARSNDNCPGYVWQVWEVGGVPDGTFQMFYPDRRPEPMYQIGRRPFPDITASLKFAAKFNQVMHNVH